MDDPAGRQRAVWLLRTRRGRDGGSITFVSDSKAGVDEAAERLGGRADGAPVETDRYRIHQLFAAGPEGRPVEFRTILHETDQV